MRRVDHSHQDSLPEKGFWAEEQSGAGLATGTGRGPVAPSARMNPLHRPSVQYSSDESLGACPFSSPTAQRYGHPV
jgi:hypothetical protein